MARIVGREYAQSDIWNVQDLKIARWLGGYAYAVATNTSQLGAEVFCW